MASVKLTGVEQIIRELNRLGDKANRVENEALKSAAQIVAQKMRQKVNISTKNQPHIRFNIEVGRVRNQGDGYKYVPIGPNKAVNWRAKFLEWGTSKMSARPFVGPAATESESRVATEIEKALKRGLGL